MSMKPKRLFRVSGTGSRIRANYKGKQQQRTKRVSSAATAAASAYNRSRNSSSSSSRQQMQTTNEQAVPINKTKQEHICSSCNQPIKDRFLLEACDKYWHEECLKCDRCQARLGDLGSSLYLKGEMNLCRQDYLEIFGQTAICSVCEKLIYASEMVMRAKQNVYHLECFACQLCGQRFCVGDRFYLFENKIVCQFDYEEHILPLQKSLFERGPVESSQSSICFIHQQTQQQQQQDNNLSVRILRKTTENSELCETGNDGFHALTNARDEEEEEVSNIHSSTDEIAATTGIPLAQRRIETKSVTAMNKQDQGVDPHQTSGAKESPIGPHSTQNHCGQQTKESPTQIIEDSNDNDLRRMSPIQNRLKCFAATGDDHRTGGSAMKHLEANEQNQMDEQHQVNSTNREELKMID